jgi:hypothetical protein
LGGIVVEPGCVIQHIGARLWLHSQSDADDEATLFTQTGVPVAEEMTPAQVRLLSYRKFFRHVYHRGQWRVQESIAKCVHSFMNHYFPNQ